MICSVHTLGISGIRGSSVVAECYISNGLPGFDIVGLPDAAVKEARERVRSAIKNNGFTFPVGRITVNLAPANLRKSGTVYDLPILVGSLTAGEQLIWQDPDCAFVGELSLSGTFRPVVACSPWPWPPGRRASNGCTSRQTAPRRPPWPRDSPSTRWRT